MHPQFFSPSPTFFAIWFPCCACLSSAVWCCERACPDPITSNLFTAVSACGEVFPFWPSFGQTTIFLCELRRFCVLLATEPSLVAPHHRYGSRLSWLRSFWPSPSKTSGYATPELEFLETQTWIWWWLHCLSIGSRLGGFAIEWCINLALCPFFLLLIWCRLLIWIWFAGCIWSANGGFLYFWIFESHFAVRGGSN